MGACTEQVGAELLDQLQELVQVDGPVLLVLVLVLFFQHVLEAFDCQVQVAYDVHFGDI